MEPAAGESSNEGQAQTTAPATNAHPVLEMRDVTITALRNPGQVMFEHVNWSVAAGDFWAIGGRHTSGKSDFMAVAAGVMAPARGTYRLFGQELFADFEQQSLNTRLRLGFVFDGGQLLNHLTLAQNIALPIRYHQPAQIQNCEERLAALLAMTQLTPWAETYPSAVSYSRRQRAGLARALALQPQLLLLDSPLTSLDPFDVAWWLDLLSQLSAGHPIAGGQPLTMVVTGDDMRPWQGRARQFAALKEHQFQTLDRPTGAALDPGRWMQDLLSSEAVTI